MNELEREVLKSSLRSDLERTIDARVDRYQSVMHQPILAHHHFAHASTECLHLYRDGYFHSCITVTQAVGEGIVTFVAQRNGISLLAKESKQELARRMKDNGIVSADLVAAFERLQRSYRNDFHHMNPPVAGVDLNEVGKANICDLAIIEREIFGYDFGPEGTLVPKNRRYWDIAGDGDVPVLVRLA